MSPRRGVWSRTLAALAILTVAASGSGLPMCVSLLARASAPCAMHEHQRGGGAQLVVGHAMSNACHDDADVGCASGGTCPTSGTAAPLAARPALSAPVLVHGAALPIDRTPHSFFSAPLPPPPQG